MIYIGFGFGFRKAILNKANLMIFFLFFFFAFFIFEAQPENVATKGIIIIIIIRIIIMQLPLGKI